MKKSRRYYRRSPNLNLNLEFIERIMDKLSKKRHLLFLTLIFSGAIIGLYIATCDIKLPLTFEHMEGNVLQRENDTAKVIKRDEVPLEMKWKVEDIYKSDEDCMKDIDWAVSQVDKISSYSGKIANSAKDLLEYIEFGNDVQYVVEKAYMYSNMRLDEDSSNPFYKNLKNKAINAYMQVDMASSFFVPEILTIDQNKIKSFMDEEPALSKYKFVLEDIQRSKPYTLSSKEERLIAMTGEMSTSPSQIYDALSYSDLDFGEIKNENGDVVELTTGRYSVFMESTDRRVRKDAYDNLYEEYIKYKNTMASVLSSSIKANIFTMNVRGFDSVRHMYMFANNIPESVYDSLIESVKARKDLLHRYVSLRKKVLGVDDFYAYDMHVPLIPDVNLKVSYSQAPEIVTSALNILGEEYVSSLKTAIENRWIDPVENQGKNSGAYACSVYGVHPYVLMNWQDDIRSVSTLAHELGHAMHYKYTNQTQPYVYADTPIFVAEVASTVNEVILNRYMSSNSQNDKMRAYILERGLRDFVSTVFRQTFFAEFEMKVYEKAEGGEALTPELLCELYASLLKEYYGPDYVVDENISMEWARIPHFYNPFYVYQYATGYSAALDIVNRITEGSPDAVEKYIDFLKAGSSDYPIEVLKIAGVDMTSPDPVNAAMNSFELMLGELETYFNK